MGIAALSRLCEALRITSRSSQAATTSASWTRWRKMQHVVAAMVGKRFCLYPAGDGPKLRYGDHIVPHRGDAELFLGHGKLAIPLHGPPLRNEAEP